MKYYKVMIDYKNFIPIDDTEVEKAISAWLVDGKALFNEGATSRIDAVIPDYARIMGWNRGYELQVEDWAEIGASKDCATAKRLIADTKLRLQGKMPEHKELTSGVKELAS